MAQILPFGTKPLWTNSPRPLPSLRLIHKSKGNGFLGNSPSATIVDSLISQAYLDIPICISTCGTLEYFDLRAQVYFSTQREKTSSF